MKIDFAIVGQPKSGTTALASFLDQHPDICISVPKEPGYFSKDHIAASYDLHGQHLYYKVRSEEQFDSIFLHGKPNQVFGEATTNYLYSVSAARNIHQHNPKAKIIALLREPASFLESLHTQYVNDGTEDQPDFKRALEIEPHRRKGEFIPETTRCPLLLYYSERIKYYDHLARYYEVFPSQQIKVIRHDHFKKNNEAVYRELLQFLGVDDNCVAEFSQVHGSKTRNMWLQRVANNPRIKSVAFDLLGPRRYRKLQLGVSSLLLKPRRSRALDSSVRQSIWSLAKDQIKRTEQLIDMDLRRPWGIC